MQVINKAIQSSSKIKISTKRIKNKNTFNTLMKLVFDLETNGFLDKDDLVIHCIVCKEIETGKVYSYTPNNLMDSLELLKKAEVIIGTTY